MVGLKRNKKPFYYATYTGKVEIMSGGLRTGEYTVGYSTPVYMEANISPATGYSQAEQFGNLDSYDKVIVTTDMSCSIDENSVLWIDKTPRYDTGGTLIVDYDYIVRRVAKSLNSISIAVSKVSVS